MLMRVEAGDSFCKTVFVDEKRRVVNNFVLLYSLFTSPTFENSAVHSSLSVVNFARNFIKKWNNPARNRQLHLGLFLFANSCANLHDFQFFSTSDAVAFS